MGDTGEAQLLIAPERSPHNAPLAPSQARLMQNAALIFYVHDSFERSLRTAFDSLPKSVRRISVTQNMTLLPRRRMSGAADNADAHDVTHGHASNRDLHVWLDTERAQIIVNLLARELTAAYPQHAARYAANARRLQARLKFLNMQLDAMLAEVRKQPFVVLHDAYHYFERRHQLSEGIGIRNALAQTLSAKRLRAVRRLIMEKTPRCLFKEPQMPARPVATVTEGISINIGVLDPLGAQLTPGESLYFDLLLRIGKEFASTCKKNKQNQ